MTVNREVANYATTYLRLDMTGTPVRWVPWQDAVCLYSRDMVAWTAGEKVFIFRGGINRATDQRSMIEVNSIIAIRRSVRRKQFRRHIPPLTNRELFLRDSHLCMYCGQQYHESRLTRDHVQPLSRGGEDRWSNIVTACQSCNTKKGNRRPEEANMPLLAIPYIPNWAEYLALSNRRILSDQMEFLKSQFFSSLDGTSS